MSIDAEPTEGDLKPGDHLRTEYYPASREAYIAVAAIMGLLGEGEERDRRMKEAIEGKPLRFQDLVHEDGTPEPPIHPTPIRGADKV